MSKDTIKWKHGAKQEILNTYAKLHEGKIGLHWLWAVIEQVTHHPEHIEAILRDYGYVKEQTIHQEREACAKIVIDIGYSDNPVEAMMPKGIKRMVADQIIEAIRDRK
jgi:hypothetical protein